MTKTTIAFAVFTILIFIGGVTLLTRNNQYSQTPSLPENVEYFWSETCPHCKKVADFIETWEGKDAFEMEKVEINDTNENTMLFLQRGTQVCKIPRNQLGVPLLITPEGKCFLGDAPIIDYLKSLEL